MSIDASLRVRAGEKCELCASADGLAVHDARPGSPQSTDTCVLVCEACQTRLANPASDEKHWYCLRESMWSEHTPVKVMAYRILKAMSDKPLAQELLSQIYLDGDAQQWADDVPAEADETVDSNGTPLQTGDTVTLIKDLDVKGANFTAKRGTTVKNIALTDDPRYVEGRVNGIRIVLVAAYLKRA